jgi:hypothetical protein
MSFQFLKLISSASSDAMVQPDILMCEPESSHELDSG